MRVAAAAEISSTARSNAAWLIFDGALKPLSLRTNCSEALWISSAVAGGSKLKRVLIFLHTSAALLQTLLRSSLHQRAGHHEADGLAQPLSLVLLQVGYGNGSLAVA